MEKGDISNEVSPRLLVVFENLLGLLPTPKDQAILDKAISRRQWGKAADTYVMNEMLCRHIWDVTWRYRHTVDVLTFLGYHMGLAIEHRLDKENLPVGRLLSTQPDLLARQIAVMPDVACVYDPDPAHQFLYGSKGRVLSPDQPDLMQAF